MLYHFISLTLFEENETISVRADKIIAVHDCPKLNPGIGSPPDPRSVVHTERLQLHVKDTHDEIMTQLRDPLQIKKAGEDLRQMVLDFIPE